MEIAPQRMVNQGIDGERFETPGEVVNWLGAVQAQDYLGALWAVGLRTRATNEAAVEQALAERAIVRTWPMRGTLHFVPAADARWMLELLAPRVIASYTGRLEREYELDAETLGRCRRAWQDALEGGRQLTRAEMYAALETAGISLKGQRGLQILGRLAMEGLICFGARAGKQQTFVLLEEWLPHSRHLTRSEALAELVRRYFTGHGPATAADFAWWSGLTLTEVQTGIETVKAHLAHENAGGKTYWFSDTRPQNAGSRPEVCLLPAFDEYTVAYSDRRALIDPQDAERLSASDILANVLVADGRVAGSWKRTIKKGTVSLAVRLTRPLTERQVQALDSAAQRYGQFLGLRVEIH